MADFTKRAIKASFLKLLDERPLSRITVKEIAADCGINRNTFYYHYEDIPALLMEIIKDNMDEILREYPAFDSFEQCVEAAIRTAINNRRVVMHIYNSINRNLYEQFIWELSKYAVGHYIDTAFPDRKISHDDREMIIRYYKCECFGIVTDWLESGMNEDAVRYFRRIFELKKDQAEELIRRCEEDCTAAEKRNG